MCLKKLEKKNGIFLNFLLVMENPKGIIFYSRTNKQKLKANKKIIKKSMGDIFGNRIKGAMIFPMRCLLTQFICYDCVFHV